MQRVLVIDKNKKALMPCHPARAKELLNAGKAAVYRRFPFTIILKEREGGDVQPVALKIDPGSKTTGLALVADFKSGKRVICSRVDSSWSGDTGCPLESASAEACASSAQDALSGGSFQQSAACCGMVSAVVAKSCGEHLDMGCSSGVARPPRVDLARVGAL